jgi:VWFA-related protein
MRIKAVTFILVAIAAETLLAGQRSQPAKVAEPYAASATAILVDVVVRDRRGRPITDLTVEDFELSEDNVSQAIGSFAVVERGGGVGIQVRRRSHGGTTLATVGEDGVDASPVTSAPPETLPTTAILFDGLSAEALTLAQRAALSSLPMSGSTQARLGVFSSEPGLRVLQPYTDDVALVRLAVQRVTAAGTARQELEVERRQALNDRLREIDTLSGGVSAERGGTFGPDTNNSTAAQAIVERQIAQSELRMSRTFETIDRDHRGFGAADALFSIVESLRMVPGRKTLVYFSEGLPASPSLQARLESVVSAANRANVSVYTIDAAGLRAQSTLSETRREVDAAAETRLRQSVSRDPTDGPLMRIVERTEDLLRLDPHGGLARLAEDTGGFLFHGTNDLRAAFRRIDEDNRFHYLLTYAPSNSEFDGKFRTIQVKVKRDGAQVFARKGYLAVRSSTPVLSYEAPALAALDRGKPPNAFPVNAVGLVFPSRSGDAVVPLVVQVRTSEFAYDVDEDRSAYSGQVTVLARIKDAGGHPVQTLSQQYILTGTSGELESAKQGEILFYRQLELPPGVYTLEAIVFDAVAERGSARLSTINVPKVSSERLAASSLVLVRKVEAVPPSDRPADLPLYYGNLLVYPNAGDPLHRGEDAELVFYFSFHPGRGQGEPSAIVEVLHSGRILASAPLELPRAATAGRVQHVGKLPVSELPPGTYELRLRLREGDQEEVRSTFFTLQG